MPRCSPSSERKRALSRIVPEPNTRPSGQARYARGDVRHDVDGVRGDQQDGVRRGAQDGGDDLAEHRRVALEQTQPGFSRSLRDTGRQDDDVGAGQCVIAAGANEIGMGEGRRVQNVLRLSGCQIRVEIGQNDLVAVPCRTIA